MADGQTAQTGGNSAVSALVVSEDSSLLSRAVALLEPHCRPITAAESWSEGLKLLAEGRGELVVLDVSAVGCTAGRCLRSVRRERRAARFVAITGPGDVDKAVDAVKHGAYDCLAKPLNSKAFLAVAKRAIDEIAESVGRGLASGRLGLSSNGKMLLGQSEAMRGVFAKIEMVRDVSSSVLIQGETGTGKELVACAIHESSPRAEGPFVKLNCGAIPKDLLESELFGHEKGSFTGALQQRIGRFEMADGGTILLDEIGDMPLDLQVKLLGVIQDRMVQRVGGHERIPINVRIVAATHQNLPKAIREKRFREDLYYRLNVVTIHVPPLRQHKEDIPLLVDHFRHVYCRETGREIDAVDPDAMRILMDYDYPGNVRELENVIESTVVMCPGRAVRRRDLPRDLSERNGGGGNEIVVRPGMSLNEVERLCITETLRYTGGDKQKAADLLGINLRTIYNKLKQYDIPADALAKQAV